MCYNCNRYVNYSSDCADWLPSKGKAIVNVGATDTIANDNNKNDAPDDVKSETIISTMYLGDYKPSYYGKCFVS